MALAKEQNDITSSDVIVAIAIESYSYTWIATQSLCIAVNAKFRLQLTLRFTSSLSIELSSVLGTFGRRIVIITPISISLIINISYYMAITSLQYAVLFSCRALNCPHPDIL